jgi:hypothetical protein
LHAERFSRESCAAEADNTSYLSGATHAAVTQAKDAFAALIYAFIIKYILAILVDRPLVCKSRKIISGSRYLPPRGADFNR